MSEPLDSSAFEKHADRANDNDDDYIAEIAAAKGWEESGGIELLLVANGVPRTFDLDRQQATALRDQLTEELDRVDPEAPDS